MSVPVIVGTAQWDAGGSNLSAHLAAMPSISGGIKAGDLIVVCYLKNGATGVGTPDAKWTKVPASDLGLAGGYGATVFFAIAAGGETGNIALTTVAGNKGGSITFVIRNWNNGNNPAASLWNQPASNTTTTNPPAVSPGWGTTDMLTFVFAVQNIAGATLTPPTGYGNLVADPGSGIGASSYAACSRSQTGISSEDPANAVWSASANTPGSITIAIQGVVDKSGTAETFAVADSSTDREFVSNDMDYTVADAITDRELTVSNDVWTLADALGDRELSSDDTASGNDARTDVNWDSSDTFAFGEGTASIEVAWTTGHIHVGRFDPTEPEYIIENNIIDYNQIADGNRVNVVVVDGNLDSWTQYDRDDLLRRDKAINLYLDLPELKSSGEVRQRAIDELGNARRANSPGGTVVWDPDYTQKDSIYWVDADGQKFTATIEGLSVEFNFSTEPFQRASLDNGNVILCDDGDPGSYIARDLFEREETDGLGDALTGGSWVTY